MQHVRNRHVHAIGRGAIDGEHARTHRLQTKWTSERDSVPNRAGLLGRRNDGHVAKGRQRLGKGVYSLGMHAVVVGDENSRHLNHRSYLVVRASDFLPVCLRLSEESETSV